MTNSKKKVIEKIEEEPIVKKKIESFTVRQFFYNEKKYDENLIKSLERNHKENKKTVKEWIEIMSFKGIVF